MRKLVIIFSIIIVFCFSNVEFSYSQSGFNTVLEFCTGTWCEACPCGHMAVEQLKQNHPETVVLAYHGPTGLSDPWAKECGDMIDVMLFNAYPTGIVGRRTGIIQYPFYEDSVEVQVNTEPLLVELTITSIDYNSSTRKLTSSIDAKALTSLSGDYYIYLVLTENNLVHPQMGNGGTCIGGSNYVHDYVVRGMINGDYGVQLNTDSSWSNGVTFTTNVDYTIPAGITPVNSDLNIIVYKRTGSMSSDSWVMQSKYTAIDNVTSIDPVNSTVQDYKLSQNYPNPFNPTTSIEFSIPEDGDVSLKFYDVLGHEVATYLDGFLRAGTYNAVFDGSNLSTGIYFYTLSTGDFTDTKKMILTK